ncbi:MAG: hypothetical protein G01um101438_126 [Parcubacteria group bacterium Gr01-1014_38]|nr:MAG: hypothetical protein G01um101438_126 [Parcubacteria group bacterium Gr01-1014_38]
MSAAILVRSPLTGTLGVGPIVRDLPDDWDEAVEILDRRMEAWTRSCKLTEYTPEIVARAWQWALREFDFGADLEEVQIGKLVELYLDS